MQGRVRHDHGSAAFIRGAAPRVAEAAIGHDDARARTDYVSGRYDYDDERDVAHDRPATTPHKTRIPGYIRYN
jgi:hypothetical protein